MGDTSGMQSGVYDLSPVKNSLKYKVATLYESIFAIVYSFMDIAIQFVWDIMITPERLYIRE